MIFRGSRSIDDENGVASKYVICLEYHKDIVGTDKNNHNKTINNTVLHS